MVEAYWSVGRRIVEEEQQGKERAEYGKEIINTLSDELSTTFGKGFSPRNLRNLRQFYLCFPDWKDLAHMCAKLTWSHIRHILRVSGKDAQLYYLKEASENNWSVRTLDRNISTLYYHRLASSQLKDPIKMKCWKKKASLQSSKFEFIKSPLKTNKITDQDIGQLDMYGRMFNDLYRTENGNPTIGILLCTEADKTIAKYSVLSENKQLFATKYLPFFPQKRS